MRLLFETRKWRAEFTASRDLRSSNASRAATEPIAELDAGTFFAARNPKRLRHLRLPRLSIHFNRLQSAKESEADCDCTPEYPGIQHYRISELSADPSGSFQLELPDHHSEGSWSKLHTDRIEGPLSELPTGHGVSYLPVQELPAASPMTPVLDNGAVYELECDLPVVSNLQDSSMDRAENTSIDVSFQVQGKWKDTPLDHMVYQALAPLATPTSPPRLHIGEHPHAPPGMVSANQSHTPSPVSPVTPSLAIAQHTATQQQPDVSPINGTVSTRPFLSPPLEQFSVEDPGYHHSEGDVSFPGSELSVTTTLAETSINARPIPGSDCFNDYQHLHFPSGSRTSAHIFQPYQYLNQESSVTSRPVAETHNSWDVGYRRAMGIDDNDNTSWWYQAFDRGHVSSGNIAVHQPSDVYDASAFLHEASCSANSSQQRIACHQADDHQSKHFRETTNKVQAVRYPKECCEHCDAEFTGKYGKGNLARHVRQKHGLVKSTIGNVCRVCKQAYNRADAKRKHEWKKHRLPDARPNKRRKER